MIALGVDAGGTKIAAGLVNQRAEVSNVRTLPTRAAEGFAVSLGQLWSAIEHSLTPDVAVIGICAPGPLNPKSGVVLNPPNLPGWRDVPLVQLAQEKFALPVRLENDCNAAGLAEVRYGAARGCSDVFYAAIGTGIGAGIILDGRIYHGKHGAAGEAGHVTIDYRSPVICGCGTPGCIEALASGRVFDRGEPLEEIAERLAAWLGGIVSLLDPERIVIGGGAAQAGGELFERVHAAVPRFTINPYAAQIPIVPAHFGVNAGIIGAATVALDFATTAG